MPVKFAISFLHTVAIGTLLAVAGAAHAAVSCTGTVSSLAFGTYSPLSATAATTTGSLSVTCTLTGNTSATVPLTVSFSTGNSGTYMSRRMLSGTSFLSYNIYKDAAHTLIYGDGTGGSYTASANPPFTLTPSSRTGTATGSMYGVIPAGQDVAAGTYGDTIVMTITY